MKRHPALQPLSDDHHRALVLARRLKNFPNHPESAALRSLAHDVRLTFERDLEPHFQFEEEWLFPRLAGSDAAKLAAQAATDHVRLRQLVDRVWAADTALEVGSLLERHVRFEERELFPAAERLLAADVLERIRETLNRREGMMGPASPRVE